MGRNWLMFQDSSSFGINIPRALCQALGIVCLTHATLNIYPVRDTGLVLMMLLPAINLVF